MFGIFKIVITTHIIILSLLVQGACSNRTTNTTTPNTPNLPQLVKSNRGNSSGNIINDGYFAQQGNWIYFSVDEPMGIYKIRAEDTNSELVSSNTAMYLNVQDDWIYYSSGRNDRQLFKMRTDGSNNTLLCEDAAAYTSVIGEWIYFANWSKNFQLNKIRVDGTERTLISEDDAKYVNVDEGWIYYRNDSDHGWLYKIRVDGTERTLITKIEFFEMNINSNWIYFQSQTDDKKRLHKIKNDGSQLTPLTDDGGSASIFLLDHIIVYYDISAGEFYQINYDGTGMKPFLNKTVKPE